MEQLTRNDVLLPVTLITVVQEFLFASITAQLPGDADGKELARRKVISGWPFGRWKTTTCQMSNFSFGT